MHASMFELLRGNFSQAVSNIHELGRYVRERGVHLGHDEFLESLAKSLGGGQPEGLRDMQRAAERLRKEPTLNFDGLMRMAQAQVEAQAGDPDRAAAILDEALETSERIGHRTFDAELQRTRGEMLLRRDPATPAPAEEALVNAIAVAKQQGTRSFELRAALSLAKLYRSTARLAEAHAVLAPALEGFSPTPEMPEIAEAQALLAALAETNEVKADAEKQAQMRQLHIAYGNALIAVRGYGALETTEAFTRVRESMADARDRLAADYGVWAGSYIRCELPSMRAHVAAFLSDVEAIPNAPEAGVAHRAAGVTHWFGGQYREARDHLERALALFQPGRDDDLAFRFGQDAGVSVMLWLALTLWPLGRVERAASLVGEAQARIAGLTYVQTRMFGKLHAALFALMHGDLLQTDSNASELASLARESGLDFFSPQGVILEGWVKAQSGLPAEGLEDIRRGAELLREQNVRVFDGLYKATLAEAEARAGDVDRAVAVLDEALATSERTGHRAFDAELHRVRGETLLKRDPANLVSAEQAFQTAIAVAKHQGTRSFELRAALPLSKLYQSTGRPADAHAVLAPALEGFAPTPEMPEIAEAQALLALLAESDEVKAQAAQRRRLTQLQVAYGNALIAARGYTAAETAEAFALARESAGRDSVSPELLAADYGLWASSWVGGDLLSARAHAAAFIRDVEAKPDSPEASVAHRTMGLCDWSAGEFLDARDHLERALALFEPGRDGDLAFRFGQDAGVAAMIYLALTLWPLGEVERADSLVDGAEARAAGLAHVQTRAYASLHAGIFEFMRGGDVSRTTSNAIELIGIARDYDLDHWRMYGVFFEGWVNAERGAPADGLAGMRRGLELLRRQNTLIFVSLLMLVLHRAEECAGDLDRAASTLDEALATSARTGQRAFDAELLRARGEMLLKRDPSDSTPAEEAFQAAAAVAKQQAARSFELRAALSLAKLYRSTGRPLEAHDVLAPALEGFAPTPEMPEIAEAQALMERLA
jgi:predicted ATPase